MKVNTRIIAFSGLTILLVLGFLSIHQYLLSRSETLASQIKIYQEITRGVTELIVVADDYMAYPYERKIGQWRSRYHRLMGAIRLTSDPRLHRLEKRLRSLKALFEKIVLHHGATKNPAPLLTERIIGKMRLVSHEILTGSYHLMDIREAALDKANRANTLFLYILSFLIAAVTIISGFLTVSSITSPLRGILEKARRISIQYEPLQDNNQGARKASGEFEALSKALDLVIEKLLESLDELEAEIRDHQQTLSSLQKSEERFELAMKFTNDGLFDWDIESNEIYYSIGWKKMLGYEDHEIQNAFSEWERLTRPEDAAASWAALQELLTGERDRFQIEFQMRHKEGHWVDILSRANVLFNEAGKGIRVVGTHVDITERKRMEKRLVQSHKMEAIGTLAGGIAHDFNNILSAVIGFTELALDDTPDSTPMHQSLQEVLIAGKRAKDLVRQILTFARHAEGEKKPTAVGPIAREVLQLVRSSIPTSIEIQTEIRSRSMVLADPVQLHQIFLNLCTNAAQAMEMQNGILRVDVRDARPPVNSARGGPAFDSGKYIEIRVADTGPGIPKAAMDKIFEPYFTSKGTGEGTGLGLAVVHGAVKSLGGNILVESGQGSGTVFTVYLPAVESAAETPINAEAAFPGGDERILLVDDEAPIAKMCSRQLEALGYTVTPRIHSIEALELFRSAPDDFDLVISDMTMPHMTGDHLAVELMKIRPDIPVILCSGYGGKISEKSASEIGIQAFACKPIVKADLAKTVREVLDAALVRKRGDTNAGGPVA